VKDRLQEKRDGVMCEVGQTDSWRLREAEVSVEQNVLTKGILVC
jgi:hypothetical protein